jgi:hypothetical protein
MLRTYVLSWKGSWEDHLPLAEFAYNNSSILLSRCHHMRHCMVDVGCVSPLCWETLGEKPLVGLDWIQQTTEKIQGIRQSLLTAQSRQKSYADVRR